MESNGARARLSQLRWENFRTTWAKFLRQLIARRPNQLTDQVLLGWNEISLLLLRDLHNYQPTRLSI